MDTGGIQICGTGAGMGHGHEWHRNTDELLCWWLLPQKSAAGMLGGTTTQ